jgi:hypothetical protein
MLAKVIGNLLRKCQSQIQVNVGAKSGEAIRSLLAPFVLKIWLT